MLLGQDSGLLLINVVMAYCVKNGINRKGGCIAITELIQIILFFLFFVFTRMGLEAISRSQMYLTITQLKIASVYKILGSLGALPRSKYTLFFYKNLFYKNVEAEIDPNFKNVLRTFLRLRVD